MADENDNLKTMGRALSKSINLTQYDLIKFSDEYQKHVLTLLERPNATIDHAKAFGEAIERLNNLQSVFVDFKSKIEVIINSPFLR